MHSFLPIPLDAKAFALGRSAVAFTVDLACFDDELWLPLVADAKHEKGVGDITGYLRLQKRLTQRPGLTTYAVVEARPAHDPPPNPASFQTLFQWPSLADYAALMQSGNAPRG